MTRLALAFKPLVALALAATCASSFAQTPIADWQIIEGVGLTDNFVFLGMTRAQSRAAATNGACAGRVEQCSFRASEDSGLITLHFNAGNRVSRIDINQTNSSIHWPTTAGVIDGMSASQVQGLYPGSKLVSVDFATQRVDAKKKGYSYQIYTVCSEDNCVSTVTHAVYKAR